MIPDDLTKILAKCPYGQVGDRLWVRETFCVLAGDEGLDYTVYKAEPEHEKYMADLIKDGHKVKWHPSIFMPRWASRITLEITGIRVQRIQEISEADAITEGALLEITKYGLTMEYQNHIEPFCELWDDINFKRGYSWESNPWVWALEFKRI
jgi:hypothetical protein